MLAVRFAAISCVPVSALAKAISHVVGVRPKKQMVRVDAARVIAAVQYMQIV